jgi:Ca-activated chloride channel homolog
MSRCKWIGYGTIAGLMFVLTACGKKEQSPPNSNEQKEPTRIEARTEAGERIGGEYSKLTSLDFDPIAPADPRTPRSPQESSIARNRRPGDAIDLSRSAFVPITQGSALGGANVGRTKLRGEGNIFGQQAGQGQPGNFGGIQLYEQESSTENYQPIFDNPYMTVKNDPLSTFSSSVDTASYSNVRARLNSGQLPPKDAVRIADMLNYFNYDYSGPKGDEPVAFSLEIAPCPWQPKHNLLRIGLKAKTIDKDKMPPRNLTFLLDTSGSMDAPNRMPLVKQSLRLLVEQLTDKDMVSIVTYAGNAGVAMLPTPGSKKDDILKVIESFNAEGSTNGAGGLTAAYEQAKSSFIKGGVNRVILATDGDFNVGISSDAELVRFIEQQRDTGIYLTVLGYGMGNLKDSKLEQLAHHGNGHYAYIDALDEAKKVFVDQGGSLATVAKDVKLQVEFNPTKVSAYRLIGYENRILRNEDFRNDAKDAGDMGSGHTCTALYEIVPVGEKVTVPPVESLKYQTVPTLTDKAKTGEFLTVRMRYKHPETNKASEVEAALAAEALGKKVSNDFEFAACVASFGMLLRDSEYRGVATYASTLETAEGLLRDKKDSLREEFARMVRVALTVEQAKEKPPVKMD